MSCLTRGDGALAAGSSPLPRLPALSGEPGGTVPPQGAGADSSRGWQWGAQRLPGEGQAEGRSHTGSRQGHIHGSCQFGHFLPFISELLRGPTWKVSERPTPHVLLFPTPTASLPWSRRPCPLCLHSPWAAWPESPCPVRGPCRCGARAAVSRPGRSSWAGTSSPVSGANFRKVSGPLGPTLGACESALNGRARLPLPLVSPSHRESLGL